MVFSTFLKSDLFNGIAATPFDGFVLDFDAVLMISSALLSSVHTTSMTFELARPEYLNLLIDFKLPFSLEKETVPDRFVFPDRFLRKQLLCLTTSHTNESAQFTILQLIGDNASSPDPFPISNDS